MYIYIYISRVIRALLSLYVSNMTKEAGKAVFDARTDASDYTNSLGIVDTSMNFCGESLLTKEIC